MECDFLVILFNFFYVCLLLKKLIKKNTFQLKKIWLDFHEIVFLLFWAENTLSESCKKFRNVILFDDYIKFSPQTFDCYNFFWIFFFNFIP